MDSRDLECPCIASAPTILTTVIRNSSSPDNRRRKMMMMMMIVAGFKPRLQRSNYPRCSLQKPEWADPSEEVFVHKT
jgi:hypothetical protein